MNDINEIIEKNAESAMCYQNHKFFFTSTAIDIFREAKARHIEITGTGVGMEALRILGRGIQPDQENSIWFRDFSDDSYDIVIQWLKERENEPFVYELFF